MLRGPLPPSLTVWANAHDVSYQPARLLAAPLAETSQSASGRWCRPKLHMRNVGEQGGLLLPGHHQWPQLRSEPPIHLPSPGSQASSPPPFTLTALPVYMQ